MNEGNPRWGKGLSVQSWVLTLRFSRVENCSELLMYLAERSAGLDINLRSHYERSELSNGVRVVTSRMTHTQAVSVVFLVGAGSRYESDAEAGVSHLFEHMLFKGTPSRPRPRDISGVVENVGGVINAFTDRECTGYWCRMALPHYKRGVEVIADIITSPLFRDADIAQEKHVVLEEIRASMDNPAALAGMTLDAALWPDQPLGRDIAGSIKSVEAIPRSTMLDYHREQYVGSNIVVAVAGNVEHDEVGEQLESLLSDLPDGEPRQMYPFEDKLDGPNVKCVERDLEQLQLALALEGVDMRDPRRAALRILTVVLGGSMGSRLFEEVREKRGLAYGIGSSMHLLTDCGAVDIHTSVEPSRAIEALRVIVDELVKIRDGITDTELNDARELAKGRMILGMEESRAVANDVAAQLLLRGDFEPLESRLKTLDAVTLDDVKSVAEHVISSDRMAMSIVGPVADARDFEAALSF